MAQSNTRIGDGADQVIFIFAQKDQYNLIFTMKSNGNPISIAPYEFKFMITDQTVTPNVTYEINYVVIDEANGQFKFPLPSTITTQFAQLTKCTIPDQPFILGFGEMKMKFVSSGVIETTGRGVVQVYHSNLTW